MSDDNPDLSESDPDSDSQDTWEYWTTSPQLYLLVIMCVTGAVFLICFVTVIVALKSDKTPKRKRSRRKRKPVEVHVPPSQASSQQELATHIQIEHTTHNETQSSYGSLEPSAPPDVPVHYGNANPASHLDTLPPSYTVATRQDQEGPYLAFGNEVLGLR